MNKPAKNIARTLALLLALSFGLSVADASLGDRDPGSRSWRTAPRHSAGIAPDPRKHTDIAIIQVYSAATVGWPMVPLAPTTRTTGLSVLMIFSFQSV